MTRLPLCLTEITKLSPTPARHVEATYVELNQLRTAGAAGPARGTAKLEDLGSVEMAGVQPVTTVLLATFATRAPATPWCGTGIYFGPKEAFRDGSQEEEQ